MPGIDYQQLDIDLSAIPPRRASRCSPSRASTWQYAPSHAGGVDTDSDLLADHLEEKLGLDPARDDTDGDGITDGYELLVLHTKADRADTDFDGRADDIEMAIGSDPLVADQLGGTGPAIPGELLLDSDGDGLGDYGEELAGTDPFDADSDDDAQLDGFEYGAGSDPLDPASTAAMADQAIPGHESPDLCRSSSRPRPTPPESLSRRRRAGCAPGRLQRSSGPSPSSASTVAYRSRTVAWRALSAAVAASRLRHSGSW